jgi:hypothetical protein
LASPLAGAECFDAESAPVGADCVVMDRDETRGVWFALPLASSLRISHLKVPELEKQIAKLEEAEMAQRDQVALYVRAAEEQKKIVSVIDGQNQLLTSRAHRAEEELDAWYRSPWLWFGAGVALTITTGVVVSVTFK